ncbi:MAG: type II toxin-antitoxin system ParD family antitoxin [Pirellulales bacterium]
MDALEFNLPDQLMEFVRVRVTQGGYQNVSEYICELVDADQRKQAWAILESEIAKGIDSGPAEPMTPQDWADLRRRVSERAQ